MRKPCLAEDWMVQEGLEMIARGERPVFLNVFGSTDEAALREVYRQSRAIRVKKIMSAEFDSARNNGDWAALEVIQFIGSFLILHTPTVLKQIEDVARRKEVTS